MAKSERKEDKIVTVRNGLLLFVVIINLCAVWLFATKAELYAIEKEVQRNTAITAQYKAVDDSRHEAVICALEAITEQLKLLVVKDTLITESLSGIDKNLTGILASIDKNLTRTTSQLEALNDKVDTQQEMFMRIPLLNNK